MKRILLILGVLFFVVSFCHAGDVSVKGYYRKDGTYVRPHHRSSPDNDLSNNYGRASYQQRQQYQSLPTLPSYNNDYDNDGVANKYDKDDDNDGISDNYDSGQYSRQKNSYKSTYTLPSSSSPYLSPGYSPSRSSSYYDNNEKDDSDYDSEDSLDYDE